MSSLSIALIALGFVLLGIGLGWLIKRFMPDRQLPDHSKEIVKAAAGLIATLVALVIGLLVSASKASFDLSTAGITQMGAKSIMLDRVLARYGPEAQPIRAAFSKSIEVALERIWPSEAGKAVDMDAVEKGTAADEIYDRIMLLEPKSEVQKHLRSQALQVMGDLQQLRWQIIEQNQNVLPTMFIVMLILWLTILYLFFSLLAPHNAVTVFSLSFCGLAVASALFLILEMNRPFHGSIRVAKAPMEKALKLIRQHESKANQ